MKKTLALLALSTLGFACGGNEDPIHGDQTAVGYVVLGTHIQNAIVFLDLNDNHLLDGNDPRVATDANGRYELTQLFAEDLAAHRIAANVRSSSLRDGTQTVGYDVTLTAPLGRADLISPFSTLIVGEMAVDTGLTVEQAHTILTQRLEASQVAFSGVGLDLFRDYVLDAQGAGPTSSDSAELRLIAETVAGVIAATVNRINENQTVVDVNESVYFDPLVVSVGDQLTAIADGTYMFAQLTPVERDTIAQNPSGFPTYFIDADVMADLWVVILAGLGPAAEALSNWIEDQVIATLWAALVEEVATTITEHCVQALIYMILSA